MDSAHLPLRIDLRLRTPWAPPQRPLHFDGLLLGVLFDRALRARRDENEIAQLHAQLPLAHEMLDGEIVYCASYV